MRPYFRTAVLVLGAVSLLCFGSCERHKASDLNHGDKAEHATKHAAPTPAPTPAQFFPTATP